MTWDSGASGKQSLTRKKLQRTYIQRVVAGPPNMFTPDVLREELQEHHQFSLCAVIAKRNHEIDLLELLTHIGAQEPESILVGRLSEDLPAGLTNHTAWTCPTFLTFDRKLEAGGIRYLLFLFRMLFVTTVQDDKGPCTKHPPCRCGSSPMGGMLP